jgi:hypothetical protein
MRNFYTLKNIDVGRPTIRYAGRTYRVVGFIGRVLPSDVGKRVYFDGDVPQVENEDQRGARTTNYEHVVDVDGLDLLRFDVTPETDGKPIQVAYGGMRRKDKYAPGAPYKRVVNVETGATSYFVRKDRP